VATGQAVNIESNFANVPSQTLLLGTGKVFQPAEATIAPTSPIDLGSARIGGTLDQTLTITNSAPATGGYTETLGGTVTGTTGSGTAAGSISGVVQGASSTGISVGLNTSTAGARSGSATLGFTTSAVMSSGLPTVSIGSQTVDVTGDVYQEAEASILPASPIDIGNAHVGGTLNQVLSISNSAPNTGGFTETLGGSVTGMTGSASATGSISGLAQGATSTAINVGLATGTAGAVSGTATLGFTTSAVNGSGLATIGIGSQTVSVTGGVYNLASATTIGSINFGKVLVGSTVAQFLTLGNNGPTGSFTEGLDATFGAITGTGASDLTGSGSVTNLVAGGTSSNALDGHRFG
jgi:hypothetical protein